MHAIAKVHKNERLLSATTATTLLCGNNGKAVKTFLLKMFASLAHHRSLFFAHQYKVIALLCSYNQKTSFSFPPIHLQKGVHVISVATTLQIQRFE